MLGDKSIIATVYKNVIATGNYKCQLEQTFNP